MIKYVKCINNQTLSLDEPSDTYAPELIVGQVYKVAPPEPNDGLDRLRVIDGSGEDYLYPANYFEPINGIGIEKSESVTVHLDPVLKGILHAEAIAAHMSVSALVRTLIDERLDLPTGA
jgi:hypothetical protein